MAVVGSRGAAKLGWATGRRAVPHTFSLPWEWQTLAGATESH